MNALDTLSMTGSELTTEQLDEIDGGVVVALAVCYVAIWALGTFDTVMIWGMTRD